MGLVSAAAPPTPETLARLTATERRQDLPCCRWALQSTLRKRRAPRPSSRASALQSCAACSTEVRLSQPLATLRESPRVPLTRLRTEPPCRCQVRLLCPSEGPPGSHQREQLPGPQCGGWGHQRQHRLRGVQPHRPHQDPPAEQELAAQDLHGSRPAHHWHRGRAGPLAWDSPGHGEHTGIASLPICVVNTWSHTASNAHSMHSRIECCRGSVSMLEHAQSQAATQHAAYAQQRTSALGYVLVAASISWLVEC